MVLRVRGRALPTGDLVDLYADGDRWTTDPVADASLVSDGGWILPGLVDAHTHPGADEPGSAFTESLLREDLVRHVDAGVTLIRAPGLAGSPPSWFGVDPELPRAFHAGPWIARPGAFFDGWGVRATPAEFPVIAAAQAARTGWCKLTGDWDEKTEPLDVDLVRAIVTAVHAVGGRVAMHCQHPDSCFAAVQGGVDSIEHGQFLDPSLVDQMARQGTALTPTLAIFTEHAQSLAGMESNPRRDRFLAGYDLMRSAAAAAAEAGVTILAGTDSRPVGTIAREIRTLASTGMPAETALGAASWTARAYLGLPGLEEGAPADAVVYDSDPRADLDVLDHPTRVILRGQVVR